MGKAYFSKQDAVLRLDRTICTYDNEPVYVCVTGEGDEHQVHIYPFEQYCKAMQGMVQCNPKLVRYTDDKFSYKQPLLGYGYSPQFGGKYFARMPDRKQKQGLSVDSLMVDGHVGGHYDYTWYLSIAMYNCLKGKYPSIQEALDHVKSGTHPVSPFARRLAFKATARGLVTLVYRCREIGIVEGFKVRLLDTKDKGFLSKIVVEAGVELCA